MTELPVDWPSIMARSIRERETQRVRDCKNGNHEWNLVGRCLNCPAQRAA